MRDYTPSRWTLALFVVFGFALVCAGALFAQDSTVVDKTGIFGPVIDKIFPVVVAFLTSLAVKVVAAANAGFAKTSEPVKWIALYAFALAFNKLAGLLGITGVDPLAPVLGLSLVQTVSAALIFKFGQRHVPTVEIA